MIESRTNSAAVFHVGKFVKESQPGRNLNYWGLRAGDKYQDDPWLQQAR
jgi:hypothetical protein